MHNWLNNFHQQNVVIDFIIKQGLAKGGGSVTKCFPSTAPRQSGEKTSFLFVILWPYAAVDRRRRKLKENIYYYYYSGGRLL
jgi:hypothetical protein